MRNLLIGSRALSYWTGMQIKDTTDWDIISVKHIPNSEWHDPNLLNNDSVGRFASKHTVDFQGETLYVVSPLGLALIKRSHLYRDLSFGKHIAHYHKFLELYMLSARQDDIHFLNERIKETEKTYPQHKISLNKSVEDFFDDGVNKVYDHDMLHELFAYEDEPMYRKMQEDHSKAFCSVDMWNKFTPEQKNRAVAEETYVIATERVLVPQRWEKPTKMAYNYALTKVCTTLTSGFFRDWAIDHYPEILALFDKNKFLGVKSKLEEV